MLQANDKLYTDLSTPRHQNEETAVVQVKIFYQQRNFAQHKYVDFAYDYHHQVEHDEESNKGLRQRPEGSMDISASPLLDTSREESCLNTDTSEEIEEPTPPRQPSTPPPSKPSPSPPVILRKPVRMLNGDPVLVKRK